MTNRGREENGLRRFRLIRDLIHLDMNLREELAHPEQVLGMENVRAGPRIVLIPIGTFRDDEYVCSVIRDGFREDANRQRAVSQLELKLGRWCGVLRGGRTPSLGMR